MNIELILAMVVLVVIAFAIIFPPLLSRRQVRESDVGQQNIAIARQKLDELKNQLQTGYIEQQQYEAQRLELETALNDDLSLCQHNERTQKQGRWVVVLIAAALPVTVIALYLVLGDPDALNRVVTQQAEKTGAPADSENMLASVAEMAEGLSQRLQNQPDDAQGWIMLGKSYKYMKQYKKAAEAFEKANILSGQQPEVMLLYADTLVMESDGHFSEKARQLIFKALEFTPNDITGLWLAGLAMAEQGEFTAALKYFKQIESLVPPDSESHQEVQVLIARLQSRVSGDAVASAAQAEAAPAAGAIEALVVKLEQRLENNPDDLQGWVMLGRSYKFLKQYKKAVTAFAKANILASDQADVMVMYADALVMNNDGHFNDQAKALIFRSLALVPDDITGLWLAGKAKVEEGAYQEALGYLRKAKMQLPPDSESYQQLQLYIANITAQMPESAVAMKIQQADVDAGSMQGIAVHVELSPALQKQAAGDDTVFVYARATSGPQMPLAVVRKQVKDLPLNVTLTDEQAMAPMMKLSKFEQVNLTARISKSGNAIQQPGDLIGSLNDVDVAAGHKVDIRIDRVVD